MSSINKVILVGRLGKDAEMKYMPNGEAVTNATLATSENWKGKAGEKQEKTEWHNLTFYRRLAEIAGEFLKKGAMIYVEGKLSTRKWQDKDGKDRYTTEIIVSDMKMLGGKPEGGQQTQQASAPQRAAQAGTTKRVSQDDGFDDDIPF